MCTTSNNYVSAIVKMVYSTDIKSMIGIPIIRNIASLAPSIVLIVQVLDKIINDSTNGRIVKYILMFLSTLCLYINNVATEKANRTRELTEELARMKKRLSAHDNKFDRQDERLSAHDNKFDRQDERLNEMERDYTTEYREYCMDIMNAQDDD